MKDGMAVELSPSEVLLVEWRSIYDDIHDTWEAYADGVTELVTKLYKQQKTPPRTTEEIEQHTSAAVAAAGVVKLNPVGFTDFILLATSGCLELAVPHEVGGVF